jgi:hypothetical protein
MHRRDVCLRHHGGSRFLERILIELSLRFGPSRHCLQDQRVWLRDRHHLRFIICGFRVVLVPSLDPAGPLAAIAGRLGFRTGRRGRSLAVAARDGRHARSWQLLDRIAFPIQPRQCTASVRLNVQARALIHDSLAPRRVHICRPHAGQSRVILPFFQGVRDACNGIVVLWLLCNLGQACEFHSQRAEFGQHNSSGSLVGLCGECASYAC